MLGGRIASILGCAATSEVLKLGFIRHVQCP